MLPEDDVLAKSTVQGMVGGQVLMAVFGQLFPFLGHAFSRQGAVRVARVNSPAYAGTHLQLLAPQVRFGRIRSETLYAAYHFVA